MEKVLYAIGDLNLGRAFTLTQITWFVGTLLIIIMFGHLPPISYIDNTLLKYLVIPCSITWFMSRKTFDGKKPYTFLRSVICYLVRPKLTYAFKPVKLEKQTIKTAITAVRSEMLNDLSD